MMILNVRKVFFAIWFLPLFITLQSDLVIGGNLRQTILENTSNVDDFIGGNLHEMTPESSQAYPMIPKKKNVTNIDRLIDISSTKHQTTQTPTETPVANELIDGCTNGLTQFFNCIKFKAIKLMDKLIGDVSPIQLTSFLYLTPVNESNVNANRRAVNQQQNQKDIANNDVNMATMSRSKNSTSVSDTLNTILARKVRSLTMAKNLQLDLKSISGLTEGRGKKDKSGMTMIAVGAGIMLLHTALSKVAFIAGKALVVGKIALILSLMITMKKLLTPDEHKESTQVIYKQAEAYHRNGGGAGASNGGGGGWHRSTIENQLPLGLGLPQQIHQVHNMAYGGHLRGQGHNIDD